MTMTIMSSCPTSSSSLSTLSDSDNPAYITNGFQGYSFRISIFFLDLAILFFFLSASSVDMENDAFMRRLSTATHTKLIRANNLAHIKLYERLEHLEQADKGLTSTRYDNQSDFHKR